MASTSGKDVQFGTPIRGKEAASRPSTGRTCEEPGCPTVLSTYNTDTRCWLHTVASYRHPLARS
jgi:hypothetical protein